MKKKAVGIDVIPLAGKTNFRFSCPRFTQYSKYKQKAKYFF